MMYNIVTVNPVHSDKHSLYVDKKENVSVYLPIIECIERIKKSVCLLKLITSKIKALDINSKEGFDG